METASGAPGAPTSTPEVLWKQVGRDNPAGQALFKLYNKDAAKKIGNSYHAKNKEVHDKKIATGWSPPPVTEPSKPHVEKPQVEVPRFPRRIPHETPHVRYIPRRKPVEAIRREIDAEYERMRAAPQAPPNRPVLDEKEKARLADMMRFRGKVPEKTPEQVAADSKHASPPTVGVPPACSPAQERAGAARGHV